MRNPRYCALRLTMNALRLLLCSTNLKMPFSTKSNRVTGAPFGSVALKSFRRSAIRICAGPFSLSFRSRRPYVLDGGIILPETGARDLGPPLTTRPIGPVEDCRLCAPGSLTRNRRRARWQPDPANTGRIALNAFFAVSLAAVLFPWASVIVTSTPVKKKMVRNDPTTTRRTRRSRPRGPDPKVAMRDDRFRTPLSVAISHSPRRS
jgi:hypothetical protein